MKKSSALLAAIVTILIMSCQNNDEITSSINEVTPLQSRDIGCFTFEQIEGNSEGCCTYLICTDYEFPSEYDISIHSSNIYSQVTALPFDDFGYRCWNLEFCDLTYVTLIIGSNQVCALPIYCEPITDTNPCPLEANYSHPMWEDSEYPDCCVFEISVSQAAPPGCKWEAETGPRGEASLEIGLARICPGETLNLNLICDDDNGGTEETFVCNLDLECE